MTQAQDNVALVAHTGHTYVQQESHAVIRECVQLLEDGDPDLALWTLRHYTDRWARMLNHDPDPDVVWVDFQNETTRQVEMWARRCLDRIYAAQECAR